MENLKSEGKCVFCEKSFAKTAIGRHLKTHFKEKTSTDKAGTSYVLKIEQNPKYGAAGYFLYLWVSNLAKMNDIDSFLRKIWLECCGHLSSFTDINMLKQRRTGYGGGLDNMFTAMDFLERGQIKKYERDFLLNVGCKLHNKFAGAKCGNRHHYSYQPTYCHRQ